MPRHFTVEEANALLPTVVPILEELRDIARSLTEIRDELASVTPAGRLNGMASRALQLEAEVTTLTPRAESILSDLYDLGVEVKDPLTGLIDFRSVRGGREVYLCWRLGEQQIAWWHDLASGVRGRRRL